MWHLGMGKVQVQPGIRFGIKVESGFKSLGLELCRFGNGVKIRVLKRWFGIWGIFVGQGTFSIMKKIGLSSKCWGFFMGKGLKLGLGKLWGKNKNVGEGVDGWNQDQGQP